MLARRAVLAVCHPVRCGWRQPSGTRREVRASSTLAEMIQAKNAENKVMIYSKSYCPFCAQAKGLFADLGVDAKVIELDQTVEGNDIQDELEDMTGQRTVPQVFIDSEFIGGCSETFDLHRGGGLVPKLDAAGVEHK